MLQFVQQHRSRCTRRQILEVGGISLLGLSWPKLLHAVDSSRSESAARGSFGRARSCVVIFLWGGPGQQDLWDLKPAAPAEIRGEFRPVATNVPGIQIGELLPALAQQADKFTIVRSVSHRDSEHGSAAYMALTGHPHPLPVTNTPARPEDFPTYGAVVKRLQRRRGAIPEAVSLGPQMHQGNRPPLAGQNAGFLGRAFDPFRVAEDPAEQDFQVQALQPYTELNAARMNDRRSLLAALDQQARNVEAAGPTALGGLYQQAFEMLHSPHTRRAFALDSEAAAVRDRYGRNTFGQTLLLARRLVEAGVPLITVSWAKQNGDQWDTHRGNYPKLRELLPRLDIGLAAFLADLSSRGLLDTTLVYCLGEFGRTPTMNENAGRDHWPNCYSVLMGGGGVRTGTVFGASDRQAAYPTVQPVAPWDLAATVYHCLGIDPGAEVHDQQGRPLRVAIGEPVDGLLG